MNSYVGKNRLHQIRIQAGFTDKGELRELMSHYEPAKKKLPYPSSNHPATTPNGSNCLYYEFMSHIRPAKGNSHIQRERERERERESE